jgi:NADPH2:quinone reductase
MKAVTFQEFGGPEKLRVEERRPLTPGPGEVVVRVAAAAVNPTDLMMLSGAQGPLMTALKPPFVAGMEFSGYISAAGDGVGLRSGTPVIGVVNPRRQSGGAQAEEIRVPANSVACVAANVDLLAAATVPMNALTAMLALELLALAPGQSLLVTGGGGAMGGYTVELAREAGLRVFANAGAGDHTFLAERGVEAILPRDEGLQEALRAACPGGVDGLIDAALIGKQISHLVRDGGGVVSLRSSYVIDDPRLKTHFVSVGKGVEDRAKIERIARLLEAGKLTPRIAPGGIFSAADAMKAYRMAKEGGFRGRVVLTFD